MKILTSIFSGFISSPIAIGWYTLLSILVNAMYDNVIVPMSALYGHKLPDVPFWQWIVLCVIIAFLQYILIPTRKNDLTRDEMVELMGKRLGVATCLFVLSYLIKWIWL